jgi:CspA family cold shock protein
VHTGTVIWYSDEKKFGFICPDGAQRGDKDQFVHISAVEAAGLRSLDEGMRVEYDLRPDKRNPARMNVFDLRLIG